MSSSFANASNFIISNSTFTHVAGSQHNYNFSGRPSTARCEAMARFVLAVNSFKPAEEQTPFNQQSEIYIHELGGSMKLPGGARAHRPDFQNFRETTHPLQPATEHPGVVFPLGVPQHIANTGNYSFVAPQSHDKEPIESDLSSYLTSENIVRKEHDDPAEQLIYAERGSPYNEDSSPLPRPEAEVVSRTSSVVSYAPALPAQVSLQPPLPLGSVPSARKSCREADSSATLPQQRLPSPFNYPDTPRNAYDADFKPFTADGVNDPRAIDAITQPSWPGKNGAVQSPLPQQNRHPVSRHISHPIASRHAYHSYPNIDPQAQLYQESYNMLHHESHYSSYSRNSHSDLQQTHQNASIQSRAPAYCWTPAIPYSYNHYALVHGGVLAPAGDGRNHGVPGASPFAAHPYYNAH